MARKSPEIPEVMCSKVDAVHATLELKDDEALLDAEFRSTRNTTLFLAAIFAVFFQ